MPEQPDPSEEFDLVTVFRSDEHTAQMEALAIQAMLEGEGIPAVVVGAQVLPVLPFEVRVPKARAEEAERLIEEYRRSGPAVAEKAEEISELPPE